MIVLWLMLIGFAVAVFATLGRRPARPAQQVSRPGAAETSLAKRSVAGLNWLTNLIGASLAALVALRLWKGRR